MLAGRMPASLPATTRIYRLSPRNPSRRYLAAQRFAPDRVSWTLPRAAGTQRKRHLRVAPMPLESTFPLPRSVWLAAGIQLSGLNWRMQNFCPLRPVHLIRWFAQSGSAICPIRIGPFVRLIGFSNRAGDSHFLWGRPRTGNRHWCRVRGDSRSWIDGCGSSHRSELLLV